MTKKANKQCGVKGCPNKHIAKGYCSKHYANFKRHGFPVKPSCSKKIEFRINENGCFECTSHKPKASGYPTFRIRQKTQQMSRFIYSEMFGEIPEGLVVRHKCDNPLCINPEHLELGTHQDNANDRVKRDRQAKGSRNGNAILNEEQVKEIKLLILGGKTNKKISEKYKVNPNVISDIRCERKWKHVKVN